METDVTIGTTLVKVSAVVAHLLISLGTDAQERTDDVLAQMSTVVLCCKALVNVFTVHSVSRQSEALRTETAIGAVVVLTAEGTAVRSLRALVDIDTLSVRADCVSCLAFAVETSVHVCTDSLSTHIRTTFIHV